MDVDNNLVRYSRAGDEFHYRWAARRCLKLIYPNSKLQSVKIEGSKESNRAGEYVIDVAEYYSRDAGKKAVSYFQLKHSTKHADEAFRLCDLKGTIEGFSKRFSDMKTSQSQMEIKFYIVSNRPFSDEFRNGLKAVVLETKEYSRFINTISRYTNLTGGRLKEFCSLLKLVGGESDYFLQRLELRSEMADVTAGTVDSSIVDSVVALVREHALPKKSGCEIICEAILQRFGVSSRRELFPAPPVLESLSLDVKREQHGELLSHILQSTTPVIIHASGGVGKSVVARQLAKSLPEGSLGIVYDCFGAGGYRNSSTPRHRHNDALVQIANEIATYGYCEPLLPTSASDVDYLRAFEDRLNNATSRLRQCYPDALVAIFIDAADNAEMAAEHRGDKGFANDLLNIQIPKECRIIELCRTERIGMLHPSSSILQIELLPFSDSETFTHLQSFFPDAETFDGVELCRLSGGNPRVQANALNAGYSSVSDVLISLGPGTTVDEQIAAQLEKAVLSVKEDLLGSYQTQIDAICQGLAVLPPYVPIEILAVVADVSQGAVRSFVSDLGHPFLHSDNSVQFRDEPTESWFRKKYSSSSQQVAEYVTRLKPLASKFSYVSQVLPSLLLQSESYEELINLALSDELLPKDNPIDAREIRVYRLQFAFKAALKDRKFSDAVKLAFLAGEEVAGDNRQIEILKNNVDMIGVFQAEHQIQELAFKRVLSASWNGSENVYSASLLSTVEDFKGEARSYLKSAWNWLNIYFEKRKEKTEHLHNDVLSDEEIVELIFACYNLFGSEAAAADLLSWSPPEVVYRVANTFVRRLIDVEHYASIDEIALYGVRNPYLIVAIASQLIQVGRFPPKDSLEKCLDLLLHKKSRIKREDGGYPRNRYISAIISFAEACVHEGLSRKKILRMVKSYSPTASFHDLSENYQRGARDLYFRAAALRFFLEGNFDPELEPLMPKNNWVKSEYDKGQETKIFKQIAGGLLPWWLTRIKVLAGDINCLSEEVQTVAQASAKARSGRHQEYDSLSFEITSVHFDILSFANKTPFDEIDISIGKLLGENKTFRLNDRIAAVRTSYRIKHLSHVRAKLEKSCYDEISNSFDEHAESIAESYVELSRAVLSESPDDAQCYFDDAVEIVSKFGDEAYERWEAVMSMAARAAEGEESSPIVAYRFMRCAELIGNHIDREKHFDRDMAIRICANLHSASAFTGLARWRERDIGRPYRQLPALVREALNMGVISPSTAWSLSTFPWEHALDEFALACIEAEQNLNSKKSIFNSAIHELRFREVSESTWRKFKAIALKFLFENSELNEIISFYDKGGSSASHKESQDSSQRTYERKESGIDWEKVLAGLDLSKRTDLNEAIERFYNISEVRYPEEFWPKVFAQIPHNQAVDFLSCVANAECANIYCVENAFSHIPEDWWQKVSVQRAWPDILETISRRFATDFLSKYRRTHFLESIKTLDEENELPNESIIDGISSSTGLLSASNFFSFISFCASEISPQEASELLEFSLERFEPHMEPSLGDGPWLNWLMPPDNATDAFSGFIWAALGSPRSETRWEATHCIRRLSEGQCVNELDSLIGWLEREGVEAFLGCSFPFYEFHARLYLFIALARVVLDYPEVIKKHSALFANYALNEKHVLIQKYASDIAKSLETSFPGTYEYEIMERIKNVNLSPFPVRETEGYHREKIESPWHEKGEVDQNLEFHFGYDFNRYWFNSLEHVFGISVQQIEELAREVVLKEWKIERGEKFNDDPRHSIYHERETWHSHSEYPKADDYTFYISYHAMFTVAAKLIQEMPVLYKKDWHEDEWSEWIDRYALTRTDGHWLADRRDPCPLERRSWVNEEKNKNWRWEIMPEDFLDGLLFERGGETWLNVFGNWSDVDGGKEEVIRISSALVAPEASLSLLNSLSTFQRCHDYKLPSYKENNFEFVTAPFTLDGWVVDEDTNNRLDKFDPFAADISYPPYQIGGRISNHFNLQEDLEKRIWQLPSSANASLICEIWSNGSIDDNRDSPVGHGKRLRASLDFMLKLSSEFNCEIIIEVQIERYLRDYAGRRDKDDFGYTEPYCKLYLLSQDGRLRDISKSYQLGKETGS